MKEILHISDFETLMVYIGLIGTVEGVKNSVSAKNMNSELARELWSLGALPFAKVFDLMDQHIEQQLSATKNRRI